MESSGLIILIYMSFERFIYIYIYIYIYAHPYLPVATSESADQEFDTNQ